MPRHSLFVFVLLFLMVGAQPAASQIIVSESSRTGERTLMSETMTRAEHNIMIRAVARVNDDRREWALTFQGTDATGDARLTADGESIEPLRIATDEEAAGGRTTVFLSGDAFYEVAYAQQVEVNLGDRTLPLPEEIQSDMQDIMQRTEN